MLNIVVPIAGKGTRFLDQGYPMPKPLIPLKRRPMIEWVSVNVRPSEKHRLIFVCRREHCVQYGLSDLLASMAPSCRIIRSGGGARGAASAVLLAASYFNNDQELIIANGDQYVEANMDSFLADSRNRGLDGNIMTFRASHAKWSYAELDSDRFVKRVAEKQVISRHATVGIYYYRRGSFFHEAAGEMIAKNIKTNGEFYVCPAYNQMIEAGRRVGIWEIPAARMHGLGTPEDLDKFKKSSAYRKLSPPHAPPVTCS